LSYGALVAAPGYAPGFARLWASPGR